MGHQVASTSTQQAACMTLRSKFAAGDDSCLCVCQGHGLIAAAEGSSQSMHDQNAAQASRPLKDMNGQQAERQPSPEAPSTPPVAEAKKKRAAPRPGDIKLICLDMDGTLLDSNSKVCIVT